MKVRAIKPGFFAGSIKNVNDEFDVPDGSTAKWFVEVADSNEPAADEKPAKGNQRGGGSRPKTDSNEPAAGSTSP